MLFSIRISPLSTLYLLGTPNHYNPSKSSFILHTLATIRPDFIFLELDQRRLRIVKQSPYIKSDQLLALNFAKSMSIPYLPVDTSDSQNMQLYASLQSSSKLSISGLLAKFKIQQFLFKKISQIVVNPELAENLKKWSYLQVMLKSRESYMLERINQQRFERGVLCCGMSHIHSLQVKMGQNMEQIEMREQ